MKRQPLFVAISDIHFTLSTLSLATTALSAAIDKANELRVPLIDCGDLTNDKAILRAEVIDAIYECVDKLQQSAYFLVGNHSLLNEKNVEKHSLSFLDDSVLLIENKPRVFMIDGKRVHMIPYQHDSKVIENYMENVDPNDFIVMHQGVNGAFMGDYIQDKSSVDPSIFKGAHTFSGHYHKHQKVGPVTYIGNPYSLTFGEANDGPKGYLIVYNDGTFEQIPLKLRKHVIVEIDCTESDFFEMHKHPLYSPEDLIWLKVKGSRSYLATLTKKQISKYLFGHENFKLDKIVVGNDEQKQIDTSKLSEKEIFDKIIDNTAESDAKKKQLKKLWREVMA